MKVRFLEMMTSLPFHSVTLAIKADHEAAEHFVCHRGPSHPGRPMGSQSGREKRRDESFPSTDERAPGYRLSPNYFQKFKRILAPDWAQKMLCIIVPNRRTVSPEFFS